jgi:hypothetical protein
MLLTEIYEIGLNLFFIAQSSLQTIPNLPQKYPIKNPFKHPPIQKQKFKKKNPNSKWPL